MQDEPPQEDGNDGVYIRVGGNLGCRDVLEEPDVGGVADPGTADHQIKIRHRGWAADHVAWERSPASKGTVFLLLPRRLASRRHSKMSMPDRQRFESTDPRAQSNDPRSGRWRPRIRGVP